MNRAVDAPAAQQRGVRRIDDGVDVECGDVSFESAQHEEMIPLRGLNRMRRERAAYAERKISYRS
jgi:hypothetical protein